MKKIAILLIALMVISVGFLSGCEEQQSANKNDFIGTNFYSDGDYDGSIHVNDPDYNTAWSTNSGTVLSQSYIRMGCWDWGSGWTISRGFLFFDTSSLAGATISSVKLHFLVDLVCNEQGSDIVLFNGQPNYPHKPMQEGDYNKNNYNDEGIISFHVSESDEGSWLTWTWSSSAYDVINKGGWTKICLRTLDDKNGVQDNTDEIGIDSGDCSGDEPYLEIEYTVQNNPS